MTAPPRSTRRLAWFKSSSGKRLYRTRTSCPCEICDAVYRKGLIVEDKLHASYLFDMECELGHRYFTRRWKRDVWEWWETILRNFKGK